MRGQTRRRRRRRGRRNATKERDEKETLPPRGSGEWGKEEAGGRRYDKDVSSRAFADSFRFFFSFLSFFLLLLLFFCFWGKETQARGVPRISSCGYVVSIGKGRRSSQGDNSLLWTRRNWGNLLRRMIFGGDDLWLVSDFFRFLFFGGKKDWNFSYASSYGVWRWQWRYVNLLNKKEVLISSDSSGEGSTMIITWLKVKKKRKKKGITQESKERMDERRSSSLPVAKLKRNFLSLSSKNIHLSELIALKAAASGNILKRRVYRIFMRNGGRETAVMYKDSRK